MGKTVVFVLSTLQQIEPVAGQVDALILCHMRELAYQELLKNECPQVVVGTPGRILALDREKDLALKNVRHFILDECDKMLESLDMRKDVQEIIKMTPHDNQVMMFSSTLSKEIRPVCKKFMQDLDHRILATATLLSIGGLWWTTRKLDIHPATRSLLGSTMGMSALQVTLGISTLVTYVPSSLGAAHQAGALLYLDNELVN